MRRFKFTLESVLTVRKKALEDERTKLASILSALNQQNEVLEAMTFEYKSLKMQSERLLTDNFNPQIIANSAAFSNKLLSDIKVQKQIIEKTRTDLKTRQQFVKEAYIKVETLEKLKERQKESYKQEVLQEEFKQIDDLVNSRRAIIA